MIFQRWFLENPKSKTDLTYTNILVVMVIISLKFTFRIKIFFRKQTTLYLPYPCVVEIPPNKPLLIC